LTVIENNQNGRAKLSKKDREAVKAFFTRNGQALLSMVELIEHSRLAVDEAIEAAGRTVIETILNMSVENLTGPPQCLTQAAHPSVLNFPGASMPHTSGPPIRP